MEGQEAWSDSAQSRRFAAAGAAVGMGDRVKNSDDYNSQEFMDANTTNLGRQRGEETRKRPC